MIPGQISMVQKMAFCTKKWHILTFKGIFYAKMAFTKPEVKFSGPEITFMAFKAL